MTLTIELEPEEMQVLADEAAALGEPVQVVARQWFRRGRAARSDTPHTHDFMAQLAQSEARIGAGTLRPLTSDDINQAIADARP